MNLAQLIRSTRSPTPREITPPTKQAALVGGVVGTGIGLSSHLLLLDYLVVTITLCLLYGIGITLLIDYIRILRQAPHDGGSWLVIAFGGTVGLVLMVIQQIYRPTVPDEIAVRQDQVLPEGAALVQIELIMVSWLLVFGVALVSLVYGIGIPITDLSEY